MEYSAPSKLNLTRSQNLTLVALSKNPHITIKSADKGGAICILDTRDYISKIRDHLCDNTTYRRLDHDTSPEIATTVLEYIEFLYIRSHIDKTTKEFLSPLNPPRTSLFYGLPKNS